MNSSERIKMVKAMEYIARNLADEEIWMDWASVGVADGDIPYGSLIILPGDKEELAYYLGDNEFSDLMRTFLAVMDRALKNGGLSCDGVVSG